MNKGKEVRISMFSIVEEDMYKASQCLAPHLSDIMANLKALMEVGEDLDSMDKEGVSEKSPDRVKGIYDFYSALIRLASFHYKTFAEVAQLAKIKMLPFEDLKEEEKERFKKIREDKGFCFDSVITGGENA